MEQQNLNFQMHREVLAKISGGVTTSTVFDFEETFFPFKKKKNSDYSRRQRIFHLVSEGAQPQCQ